MPCSHRVRGTHTLPGKLPGAPRDACGCSCAGRGAKPVLIKFCKLGLGKKNCDLAVYLTLRGTD